MKIELQPGQNVFFTSDSHYGHSNITFGTSNWRDSNGNVPVDETRPFDTVEEMSEVIVNGINNKVGENDILFHLGDFAFNNSTVEFRNKINCKNIHLILGNHCQNIEKNRDNVQSLFLSVQHYLNLDLRVKNGKLVDKYNFILMHYPIASWDGMKKGSILLYGHLHLPYNLKIGPGRSLDIGADGNNYESYSYKEIYNLLKNQPIRNLIIPLDHHSKEFK